MINVAYRTTPWSEHTAVRQFMPGATVQEIVDSFDKPVEFATHGGVYLHAPLQPAFAGDVLDDPEQWRSIRPKDGTCLFISLVPQGGGGGEGGGGKSIFAIIGAIALIALTAWVGGGGLAFLAPTIFGAGTIGASVAAAAIGVAGSAALSLLSKPSGGAASAQGSGDVGATRGLGSAGVAQNSLAAYHQVAAVRGIIRVSPQLLARPFTTIEDTDQVLNMIVGVCGRCSIEGIKINDTDIADLPSGVLEYETLEGWDDDPLLTLITESAFEENINLQMSTHRLDIDQTTLILPYSGSYAKAYLCRTARNTDRFRYTLNFGSGLANYNNGNDVAVAFRIRIRAVGDSTWINLPELHINASRRDPFRQELWLRWGNDDDEDVYRDDFAGVTTLWKRCYYKNTEWTANSYFLATGITPGATDSNVVHVYRGPDFVYVHLDSDTFPIGQYDVEITRGFADAASNHTDTTYTAGMFTYRTLTGSVQSIPVQNTVSHQVSIENYCSFRNEYPIADKNMAVIAIKARNLQVNSLSAVFGSYVNVWNGADWDDVEVSNNPAALLRDVLIGNLNARPIPVARLEDLSDWFDHCVDKGLTCNHVVTEGSVEQIGDLVAACGDAAMRRSDRWGVVIDKDRSAEPITGAFHPGNMTSPLVVTKKFVTGARAIIPNIRDADRDYAARDLDSPIFDDGVASSVDTLTEGAVYDGLTTVALAERRAVLDLRRARLRTIKYAWSVHLSHLKNKKGDLTGLAHDILVDTYGTGRVVSFKKDGSNNIVSVTMNTNFADLPVSGYDNLFDVENVYTLSNLFTLAGPSIGLQIELPDATVATIPVSGVDDRTLLVDGTVASPSGLKRGCLAAVGRRDRENRRVILTSIMPKNDFFADLEAVDEAPEIFNGI